MNGDSRGPLVRALNYLAIAITLLAVVLAVGWLSGRDSSQGVAGSQTQIGQFSTPTPIATATMTPVAPDRQSIEAVALAWMQTWHAGRKNATPVPATLKLYAPEMHSSQDLADAYADLIESEGDNNGTIDSIHGATADITMTYGLPTTTHGSLRWRIDGSLHFVHGRSGWLIDKEWWANRTITGLQTADGNVEDVSDSRITGDESVQFHVNGVPYEWTRLPKFSWKLVVLASPSPTAAAEVWYTPDATEPQQQAATDSAPENQTYVPPTRYMPDTYAGCEDVSVSDVYGDGEILELDDGRRLRVDDSDTSTSSVWTAPFDGLICDGGDKFINKDENESVDLQP